MEDASIQVLHDEEKACGTFYVLRDGDRLAEMTYTCSGPDRIVINHTEVDDSLRGQGVGRKLLDACVAWAEARGAQVSATCPYAKAQLEKNPSLRETRG